MFFQQWSNLHDRTAIGWIKRKTKFQIFPIFIFWVMQKNIVEENYLNAVEHEPVLTRFLNPKACRVQGQSPPQNKKHKYSIGFFEEKKFVQNFNKNFKIFKFTWKIQNRLNIKKNQISDFFFELWSFLCSKWPHNSHP